MLSEASGLLDTGALAVVLAGSGLATLAQRGARDVALAIPATLQLARAGFDANANRAAMARNVREVRERGHLGARPVSPPDEAINQWLDAYLASGSIEAMRVTAHAAQQTREGDRQSAVQVFESAGELAPVFGLVGTLYAITQLMPDMGSGDTPVVMAAVASAVLSSLYGVLCAHLLFFPAARAIQRRGQREETARSALLDWFADELEGKSKRAVTGLRGAA